MKLSVLHKLTAEEKVCDHPFEMKLNTSYTDNENVATVTNVRHITLPGKLRLNATVANNDYVYLNSQNWKIS